MTATVTDSITGPVFAETINASPRVPGTLWERASDVDGTATDRRGYFLAFYAITPKGGYPRGRRPFDTPQEAQAWIDANHAPFPCNVIAGHRLTKSGKIYRLDTPPKES